jgi:hypothetical protein
VARDVRRHPPQRRLRGALGHAVGP